MSERAFIRTIVENPDDDTARLVFADWPRRTGRSRAARSFALNVNSPGSHPMIPVRPHCRPKRVGYPDRRSRPLSALSPRRSSRITTRIMRAAMFTIAACWTARG